jgi:hypothetical protein
MMLVFAVAVIWGSLSAQFLVQTILSFVIALLYLVGVAFSKVSKALNATGFLMSFVQSVTFGVIFVGGNYLSSYYISYDSWNAASTASVVSFLATVIYVSRQIPGKLRLAKMCAWVPYFFEASNCVPRSERVAFARRYPSDSHL